MQIKKFQKTITLLSIFFIVGMLSTFRFGVGTDWDSYYEYYNSISTNQDVSLFNIEYGYELIVRFLQYAFGSFQANLFALYFLSAGPIFFIIINSKNGIENTVLFFASSLFLIYPVRQDIAVGFFALAIFISTKKNETFKSNLLLIFAALIHKSTILPAAMSFGLIVIAFVAIFFVIFFFNSFFMYFDIGWVQYIQVELSRKLFDEFSLKLHPLNFVVFFLRIIEVIGVYYLAKKIKVNPRIKIIFIGLGILYASFSLVDAYSFERISKFFDAVEIVVVGLLTFKKSVFDYSIRFYLLMIAPSYRLFFYLNSYYDYKFPYKSIF